MFRRRRVRKRDHSLFSNATALIACGLLAGVVVAAAVFPAVAMSGLAAKAGADGFDDLPTQLTVTRSPQISYVYASDGKTLISTFYDENRRDVPIAQVAEVMQHAMVAAEDMRFYQHHGVDVKGAARALVANQQSGQTEQGASTLTMQYVRQAIEYSASSPQEVVDATSDTPARKLREMRYALALEKTLNKQQILERYMNIAPFGNGAFGIYAAAEVYFGKPPGQLNLAEASLLAGLPKAPSSYDPMTTQGLKFAMERRDNYVLANMVKMGYISEAERQAVIKAPLKFTGKPTPNGCALVTNNSWGFFCDYFYRWWLQQPAFGADAYERENRLKTGGYSIVTSLDVGAQAAAKKHIEQLDKTGSNPSALMLAGVEPGTGHIELMAANRNYSNDQSHNPLTTDPMKRKYGVRGNTPNTTNPLISGGGDINGYQAGSSFKVFTMVAALEQGVSLNYNIDTTSPYVSHYVIDPGSPAACNGPHYCPVNDNPSWMNGSRNMWTGLGRSVNTYWVPMEEKIGAQNAVNAAKSLGIQFRAGNDAKLAANASQWGAFTLGVSATTPLDMANAYASLAADGKYCEPLPVVAIRDFSGAKLDAATPRCHQAVPVNVARAAVDAMRCPVGDQSTYGQCDGATAANIRGMVGKPTAGKTGTTDGNMTATLIAMTKQLAVGGILADPDWPTTTHLVRDVGGRDPHAGVVNPAVGETLHDFMVGKPGIGFTAPPRNLAFGKQSGMPNVTCQSVASATSKLKGAGFKVTVDRTPMTSKCAAGTVAQASLSGGTVTLIVSKGGGATTPPTRGGVKPPTRGAPPSRGGHG
ncbi:transglycosylase domain-containing protein [Rugosimonospora africana]|uniref:Carboxypeptidase n=1 Tax=Rugosimonospora africana TaxID=556532 RepID=A0A8J3QS03_9ACTN|nr:transglycosylase domain-containing protein [Rugosimonospora africana]GIH16425.1 carboxypeptidase [Rugosimonospora africana]